jgi:hypothetical protein
VSPKAVVLAVLFLFLSIAGAAQEPDVQVSTEQFGQTIVVAVGRVIAIPRPADIEEWNVDYASEVLSSLGPPDHKKKPGPKGWRFLAAAAGETDVTFTAVPPKCLEQVPCSPPPALRFTITIRVSR